VGSLGWRVATASGGSLSPATEPRPDTPGWYELRTGGAADGSCALRLDEVSLSGHPLFVWEARVAPQAANRAGQTSTWRIGLHDGTIGAAPRNGFYFEQAADAATLRCRTAAGGAPSDEDAGVELAPGTAHRLRITSDGGGAAYFSVDDEIVATITRDLPAARGAFGLSITLEKTAGTGTEHALVVDYVYLLWGVSR
jgi:hypothetical protein